jgi:hypothetical protein
VPKDSYQYRDPVVIERWCCILHDPDSVSEEEESQDPWGRRKLRWLRVLSIGREHSMGTGQQLPSHSNRIPNWEVPLTHTTHDQKFAQQEQEVSNFVQDSHSARDKERQV